MAAVKAGTDLTCGTEYRTLVDEVKAGRITEAEIDRSLERLFVARFRLGMFDPPERVPFSKIPISENDSSAHRQVARDAEREAIVLLKNEGGVLPLEPVGAQDRGHRSLGGRSRRAAGELQRHLVQAGDAARGDRAAVPGRRRCATRSARPTRPPLPRSFPSTFLTPPEGKGPGVLVEYFDNPDLQGEPKLRRTRAAPVLRHGDGGPRRGRGRRPREVLGALDGHADAAGDAASTS